MRIIDSDIRLVPGEYDVPQILSDMKMADVSMALVSDAVRVRNESDYEQAIRLNSLSLRCSGKLLGMVTIDPNEYIPGTIEKIRRDLPQIVGVKISSAQCGVALDDQKRIGPVAEELIAACMPLFAEVTASVFDLTHPFRLEKLLTAWPALRVAAVHMGGASRPDFCSDVFSVANRCGNLWLTGSANYWQRILQAISEVGTDRVMFGSAAPEYCFMVSAVAAYRAMFEIDKIPASVQEKVFSGNIDQFIRGH